MMVGSSSRLGRYEGRDRENDRVKRYRNDQEYRLLYDLISGFVKRLLDDYDLETVEKYEWQSHDAKEAVELYKLYAPYRFFHKWVSKLLDGLLLPSSSDDANLEPDDDDDALKRYISDIDYRKVHDWICYYIVLQARMSEITAPSNYEAVSRLIDEVLLPVKYNGALQFNKEILEKMRMMPSLRPVLPHEILRYAAVDNSGLGAQDWKGLINSFSGKFERWMAVWDTSHSCRLHKVAKEVAVSLGLFMSELATEPWKGKVIKYAQEPHMDSLQGIDYSLTKYSMDMDGGSSRAINFEKLFDLILETAVKGNLKPKQMVKRVLVLTPQDFDAGIESSWRSSYTKIKKKYLEEGYLVPKMVFWSLLSKPFDFATSADNWVISRHLPGLRTVRGFSDCIILAFLQKEGRIGRDDFRNFVPSDPPIVGDRWFCQWG